MLCEHSALKYFGDLELGGSEVTDPKDDYIVCAEECHCAFHYGQVALGMIQSQNTAFYNLNPLQMTKRISLNKQYIYQVVPDSEGLGPMKKHEGKASVASVRVS